MFMGDMPVLMENILNNLNNEFYSLYSCALVNRHWCKMSIPILWQDPFSIGRRRNELFFSRLQDLSLSVGSISDLNIENATILLKILAKDTTKLSTLKLDEFNPDYEPQLLSALICIIKSQEQLRQFRLIGEESPTEF
ncbi:hypothetical protein F8M41_007859 [Gigaspora margarita]|uniref:F-box domain-containing protein n=1 Tax=Gigaspora margarita TaxID=4874 RepID=A0A8H3X4C1_GIGMA|nr:hypothetical protein F8M41_007859 [Gigaspora margarita]